jgi:hypothetical protein
MGKAYATDVVATAEGLVLAWSAPSGAMLAFVPQGARAARSMLLGNVDAARASAPRVWETERGVAVVWCEADGAYLAVVAPEKETFLAPPYCIVPGARHVAASATRQRTRLFFHDGEGILAGTVDARGDFQRDRERWWSYGAVPVGLAAARATNTDLCFVAFEGEAALWLLFEGDDGVERVRHDLPTPALSLGATGAGNRAGVALVLDEGGRLDTATVSARGKTIEAVGPLVEGRGAHFRSVAMTWVESDFAVLAHDPRSNVGTLVRRGDGEVLATFPRCAERPAITYRGQQLVLASAVQSESDPDSAVVAVHTSAVDGSQLSTRTLDVAPPPLLAHERGLAAVKTLATELEAMVARATYRDSGSRRSEVANGAVVELPGARQRLELRADQGAFVVALSSLRDGAAAEPVPESSFERLARWVRERISKEVREEAMAERAWIAGVCEALGGEAPEATLDADHGITLTMRVASLPAAPALVAWLERVRRELAERAWRAEGAPGA